MPESAPPGTIYRTIQRFSDYPCPRGHHNVSLLSPGRAGAPEIWGCGDCGWKGAEAELVAPPPTPRSGILSAHYAIDYEAMADCHDPQELVTMLDENMRRPGWHLNRTCRGCEVWDETKQLQRSLVNLPRRPQAKDSAVGCNGCIYSFLDAKDELRLERDWGYWSSQRDRAEDALKRLKDAGMGARAVAMAEARVVELEEVRKRFHA